MLIWAENDAVRTNIYGRRWTGVAWQTIANGLNPGTSNAVVNSLALSSADVPVITWSQTDDGGTERVHAYQQQGGAFQPLGTDPISAAPGGVEANTPVVAVDPFNRTVLAWEEKVGGTTNLYVWRYQP